jgi:enamine deaminase RidA (YjgF/YER057c/UK114 family)
MAAVPIDGLFDGVPYEYSSVVAPASLVFTAGACPLDADGKVVAPGDHAAQAERALSNLLTVLARRRCGPEHLVRTTVYVVGDRDDLGRAWGVIAAGLSPHRPPSTLVGVTTLGYPDQLVEIDGIAAIPATD